MSYFWFEYSSSVKKGTKGKNNGVEIGLYFWAFKHALDKELENIVAPLYEKLITYNELTKMKNFVLSQLVRTSGYIEYEDLLTVKRIEELPRVR